VLIAPKLRVVLRGRPGGVHRQVEVIVVPWLPTQEQPVVEPILAGIQPIDRHDESGSLEPLFNVGLGQQDGHCH